MSGLLALLDDVAAIAKVAAASVDDVVGQAAKAGAKAAGAAIDDAAVTPKYVTGFDAARELPIIWRIARGSLLNKLIFLLPAGLALSAFAPWAITPLLMLGGCYLCFEGAEKVAHALGWAHHEKSHVKKTAPGDSAHLEEQKVKGAIKTDFILSAEIMTIALSAIPESTFWMEAATLATVAVMITVAIYGAVALIVKADDVGLWMAAASRLAALRSLGKGIVAMMPKVLALLMIVGTAAMLWVGGNIVLHGLEVLGWHWPYDTVHHIAKVATQGMEQGRAAANWALVATMDGLFGLALGFVLIPIGTKVITPVWQKLRKVNPVA
ncbi:hypothetical protein SAMN05421666_1728 [Roseovarius nanhaiticus]|uniref:Inner membrane protein YedI n=1 Tax=Roseovarius nanhaiticus TaxID=573024 RepID=A0A1N7G6W1_9RHOB|nr:DUF808 domain-containing protein [Roseovarius nanhaiticus]SEK35611.1 hypothetical protein SAMN05216208_0408 [Roseovarius nanhaiticus]SIS08319.1 hypothetical protein SAMN05421666_1728 [Roseovarius nanhaiticus]